MNIVRYLGFVVTIFVLQCHFLDYRDFGDSVNNVWFPIIWVKKLHGKNGLIYKR